MVTAELNDRRQENGAQDGAETDEAPLDPARAAEAAELAGPTAVGHYEPPMDAHQAFVAEQYEGMDHMD